MKMTVVHRRWRYVDNRGLKLVATREYKRIMKLWNMTNLIYFHHYICEINRYDGAPYDVIHIEIDTHSST